MQNNNAKFSFYYLLSLVALIFTSLSIGVIIFQIINKNIFDHLNEYNYISEGVLRFFVSSLIISSPVFFLTIKLINNGLKNKEIEKNSGIRKWLTYLILFISSIIILGSLIGVLNSFLSGEMTLKFVLKIITLIIISALVFSYYFYDIKRETVEKSDKKIKIFFIVSLFFILTTFIFALFSIESPSIARNRKEDQKTLSKIYELESLVNNYYFENEALPESLDDLLSDGNNLNNYDNLDYKKIDDEKFDLCANFKTSTPDAPFRSPYGDKNFIQGHNCFKGTLWIDKR